MPKAVMRAVDGLVDEMLPEVEAEIKAKVYDKVLRKVETPRKDRELSALSCLFPCWLRARVLYTLYPFDQSVWEKLRNPVWWILTLVTAFPRYGVHQAAYLLLFLIRDKRDEFQLVSFITAFKGMQFIAQGIIPIIVGSIQLYFCTYSEENSCEDNGPEAEYFEVGFFLLQIILVWLAFALLPFSEKKGANRYHVTEQEEETEKRPVCFCGPMGHPRRGGRLASWILYDTLIFFLCAGFMVYVVFWGPFKARGSDYEEDEWMLKGTLYWLKAAYGLLSAPFFIFKLPLFSSLLTHAAPTAYNKQGICVPLKKKKKVKTWKGEVVVQDEDDGGAAYV